MSEMPPDELDALLDSPDADPLVLDVRPESAFDDWHVPGSRNVDVYEQLEEDPDAAREALADLPTDREIVTVCAKGVRSAVATELLLAAGYDARTLVDGMAGWSRVHRSAPVPTDLDGTLIQVARPGTGCLSHVLVADGEAAVFDPSLYVEQYEAVLVERGVDLVAVYDSHAHADHVSGGRRLADRHDAPYHLHEADAAGLDATSLADGAVHAVGDVEVEVIHTPGHSPGSVSFALGDAALLTGDTLFHGSVGRVELGVEADLEDASVADNAARLYESLQRLRDRPGDPVVLPAHDPGTPDPPVMARLSEVLDSNPDLGLDREAFVARLAGDVPDQPDNFERIKRVNVGADDVEDPAALESGPNNCAAN